MSCDIAYMQNLNKNDINEIIYKAEIDSQKIILWLQKGKGWDKIGVWY